MGKAETF